MATSIFYDVQQNSQEWFELRKGVITSSNFSKIMANEGKAFGEPAKKYAVKLALEIEKNEVIKEEYSNSYFERGHEYEPIARQKYEEETFTNILNGGFFKHLKLNVGDSPDGLIQGTNGGLEIKSVIYTNQNATLKRQDADPTYKYQYQGHIWLGDLEWIDFVSYCPECTLKNQLFIKRVYRNDQIIQLMEKRIIDFIELIEKEKQFV